MNQSEQGSLTRLDESWSVYSGRHRIFYFLYFGVFFFFFFFFGDEVRRGGEVKSEREGVTRTFTQGTVMSRDLEVCREIERLLSGSIYVTIS